MSTLFLGYIRNSCAFSLVVFGIRFFREKIYIRSLLTLGSNSVVIFRSNFISCVTESAYRTCREAFFYLFIFLRGHPAATLFFLLFPDECRRSLMLVMPEHMKNVFF